MNHILYGLIAGHRQRRSLGRLLAAAPDQGTVEVDLEALRSTGILALAFDFDGVLAPHAAEHPLAEAEVVLRRALQIFGPGHVYILSNKPSVERLTWFRQHFPEIRFVSGVRKKPYPDGLQQVAVQGDYAPEQIALLDDRLLTGGLACLHAGSRFVYISRVYRDFSRHLFKESFFSCLRSCERLLARFAA